MNNRDVTQHISGDILQHQLQLAKNATPGEWYDAGNGIIAAKRGARTPNPVAQVDNEKDAAHIAANSPDVVTANIDEILRLRAEVEFWKQEVEDVREIHARIISHSKARTIQLEREAHWLASCCTHFCNSLPEGNACENCPARLPPCRQFSPTENPSFWIEAARKAGERES